MSINVKDHINSIESMLVELTEYVEDIKSAGEAMYWALTTEGTSLSAHNATFAWEQVR